MSTQDAPQGPVSALGPGCRLPSDVTSSSIRHPPLFGFDPSPFQHDLPQVFPCLAQLLLHLRNQVLQNHDVPEEHLFTFRVSFDSQLRLSFNGFLESASFLVHLRNGVLPPVQLFFQTLASGFHLLCCFAKNLRLNNFTNRSSGVRTTTIGTETSTHSLTSHQRSLSTCLPLPPPNPSHELSHSHFKEFHSKRAYKPQRPFLFLPLHTFAIFLFWPPCSLFPLLRLCLPLPPSTNC